jgi:hypothetical protein
VHGNAGRDGLDISNKDMLRIECYSTDLAGTLQANVDWD